ncbi:hypothetical protein [Arthrobacter mangrovi]|nr:hypothetical protein [Arthrobacter mangrovi]
MVFLSRSCFHYASLRWDYGARWLEVIWEDAERHTALPTGGTLF